MQREVIPRSFATHDGSFHADEVTACALLLLVDLIDRNKIFRTRDRAQFIQADYVCDVGGVWNPEERLFDHHQAEYQGELSSAGMILLYLKEIGKITSKEFDVLRRNLVKGVDAHDNGQDPLIEGLCTYSHIIANFNPVPQTANKEELEKAYAQALEFALGHLRRIMGRIAYVQSCRDQVAAAMQAKDKCLVFEESIPWLELFFELGGEAHPAEFLIMPSGSHWKMRGIPPTLEEKMKVRRPLPKEWAGLLEDELREATGIPGAIFCHKGRFISVWETKHDALKAFELMETIS